MVMDSQVISRQVLRMGLTSARVPPPCILVIFGATGDLTHRKLVPSLFDLYCDKKLSPSFTIVGFARREKSHDDFRNEMREAVNQFARNKAATDHRWDEFARGLFYHRSEFGDADGYTRLAE